VAGDNLTEIDEREVASLSTTVLSANAPPSIRTISSCSSWRGLPSKLQLTALGSDEARTVKRGDRLGVGESRSNHFASARVAGHKMGFNQPGGDLKVGFYKAPVEADNCPAGGCRSEQEVVLIPGGVMVLDADGAEHPGIADQFVQLGAQIRTVQTCCDQHPNGRRRGEPLFLRAAPF
jgi:hypothetical protein